MAEVAQLVQALLSTDKATREQAENAYNQSKVSNPDQILQGMAGLAGTAGADLAVRKQAAILLRQMVAPSDDEKKWVWSRIAAGSKQAIGGSLLQLYQNEQDAGMQKKFGEVLEVAARSTFGEKAQGWIGQAQGWPELLQLVFTMADPSKNQNMSSCETSIRLLQDLIDPIQNQLGQAQAALSGIIQNAFGSADIKVKVAGGLLVCEMVGVLEKKVWAPLTATVPVLVQLLQGLAGNQAHGELLSELLQALAEVAEVEADFFKSSLESSAEPAQTLSQIAMAKDQVDESARRLALNWMKCYIEQKPKWLAKKAPRVPELAVECCLKMMLEIDSDESALKEWVERMDDEEGEEDADEQFHAGEEDLDGIVEAMGMDAVSGVLFKNIGEFANRPEWQARHAALAAIKQTVEYVEEEGHVTEMAKMLVSNYDHAHPRVRYTALHATGQLANDQAPHFQEAWHKQLMPEFLRKMDDGVERVASMAMSAFVSFGSEMEKPLLLPYVEPLMEKLVGKLKSSNHRMVQEECITSIAVIAGVIEKDITKYYSNLTPLLTQVIQKCTDEKQARLRGKAFECFGLLAIAVGPDGFRNDAKTVIPAMFQNAQKLEESNLESEYLWETISRFSKCLKKEFAPFMQGVHPLLMKLLTVQMLEDKDVDGDEEVAQIQGADGKISKVKTSALETLGSSLTALEELCDNMEDSFLPFVQQTVQGLQPLIEPSCKLHMLYDEARQSAYSCWAKLIKCSKNDAATKGQLLQLFLQKVGQSLTEEKVVQDPETVTACTDGIAKCLTNAGPGCLDAQTTQQLSQKCFQLIELSLQRTAEFEKLKKDSSEGLAAELQGDEDDEEEGDLEETCRRGTEEALAKIMEVAPDVFVQQMSQEVSTKLQQWLPSKQNKTLGLFLVSDLLKSLKEKSQPFWGVSMQAVFQGLTDKDAGVRIPAAYALNCAAPIPAFKEAAPQAFQALATYIAQPAPKKRDAKGKVALDNVVAAMLSLARYQGDACPPQIKPWQLALSKLPLREDEEEAKECHKNLLECVLTQHPGMLADQENLGQALRVFAEVHTNEALSTEEVDKQIVQIFKTINPDILRQLAGNFTEKQQKKIELIISSN